MSAYSLALRALLAASEAYVAAARAHHEASFYEDDEAMDQANIDAEVAYKALVEAQLEARRALDPSGAADPAPDAPAPLKRFVLFAYEDYYPAGAQGDFEGSFDTLAEVRRRVEALGRENWDVLDLESRTWVDSLPGA